MQMFSFFENTAREENNDDDDDDNATCRRSNGVYVFRKMFISSTRTRIVVGRAFGIVVNVGRRRVIEIK